MSTDVDIKTYPTTDPRLGWISIHDPKSLDYCIRPCLAERREVIEDIPKTWTPGAVLDQGQEGSCVGHGWTGELLASPKPDPYTSPLPGHQYAIGVYHRAQQIDDYPGENYSGTSVLAGAKVVNERGFNDSYRWCLSIDDVRDTVIASGPVVIGIPWYDSMYETRASGLINVEGDLVGGHCLLVHGYHPGMRIPGEDYNTRFRVFKLRNSWGPSYGKGGTGYIRYEDLRDLLANDGEACTSVGRKTVRLTTT